MEPSSLEGSPERAGDIKQFYNNLIDKNADLNQRKMILELEIKICEKKYTDVKKRLTSVNQALRENLHLFQTLVDVTKIPLNLCTLTAVGTLANKGTPKKAAPAPKSIILHQKLHLEPLNLKKCTDQKVVESERSFVTASVLEESPEKLKSKEMIVNMDKLPANVVNRYSLAGQLSRWDSSELDKERSRVTKKKIKKEKKGASSKSPISRLKSLSNTPNSSPSSPFSNSNGTKKSPKNGVKRGARKVFGNSPGPSASATATHVTKRKKSFVESPEEKSALSRPQRKAKPKVLKEESLKTKKRRPT